MFAAKPSVANGLPSKRPSAPSMPAKAPGKGGPKDKALLRLEKQLQEEAVVSSPFSLVLCCSTSAHSHYDLPKDALLGMPAGCFLSRGKEWGKRGCFIGCF